MMSPNSGSAHAHANANAHACTTSTTSAATGSRDVGVAVALRRAQRQLQQQQKQKKVETTTGSSPTTSNTTTTTASPNKQTQRRRQHPTRPRAWWHDLGIGLSLYLTCIYLPTLYHCFSYLYNYIWCPLAKSFCKELLGGDAAWTDVAIIFVVSLSLAMIRITVIQRLVDMPLPIHVEAMVRCKSIHLLSSAYPQSLTPKSKHQQHQLHTIANFELAPPLPLLMNHNHQLNEVLPSLDTSHTSVSTMQQQQQQEQQSTASSSSSSPIAAAKLALQPRVKRSMSMPNTMNKSPSWVERYVNDSLLLIIHEHTHPQFSISLLVSPLSTTATMTSSTWETVRRSSQQATLIVVPADANNPRLHAAPRYATAAFQCLYSAFSLATAWFCFSHSNIWPPAVFGNGATKNCWNLKGSLGMAEDFDGLDALLKLYYLLQASYHVHSGAFHILTMVLLWSRRKQYPIEHKNNDKRDNGGPQEGEEQQQPKQQHKQKQQLVGNAKPFTAYWRSLLQHCIALLLIGGSHLFASTRRLGAIGNFALDASSLALHILQLCINAAPIHNNNNEKMTIRTTRYRKDNNSNDNNSNYSPQLLYIKILHRGIVIPLFIYCRFYVWPFVVWRSAMFESKEWLQQMESTLFPGIYRAMLYVFTGLVIILLGLNLVLFRRLVNHPHLQRVYDNGNNSNNTNANANANVNAKKNKNEKYNTTKNDGHKSSILSSTQQQQQKQHQQQSQDLEFRLNPACGNGSHAVPPFVATTAPDQFSR